MKIEPISRWRRELGRDIMQRRTPTEPVGSYPCQESAGCITATIWPPESALRAFRMNNREDQQLVNCACEPITEHGEQFLRLSPHQSALPSRRSFANLPTYA
jgi:hypothetical protein